MYLWMSTPSMQLMHCHDTCIDHNSYMASQATEVCLLSIQKIWVLKLSVFQDMLYNHTAQPVSQPVSQPISHKS